MRICAVLLVLAVLAGCDRPPSVNVDGEQLVGKYEHGVATFLGVPFAAPPVGDLRWAAPQPLSAKVDKRVVTEFAPACMQTMRILDWYRYMAETFGGSGDYYDDLEVSEDCLYLNVWTPAVDPDAGLPVMVWVHGGGNNSGWAYEDNYRGHVLAPQGAVVVTVAYRLGVFGFLSHPELEGSDAVANFGLWDLVAALEWIQGNIAAFGGDPDRVTLFGESAGGENLLALMMARESRDLFHRGVPQSGAGYGTDMPTLDGEMQRGAALAEVAGAESLAALRSISADELLEIYTANFDDHYHSPAIDGQLIDVSTWDAIQSHDFSTHDLMIGTNDDEWLDFIDIDASDDDLVRTATNNSRIGGEDALPLVAGDSVRRAMDRLITAEKMVCPSQNVAAHRTASGGNAWVYLLTRQREDEGGEAIGAYHGAEYPYIFGVHDAYMTTTPYDLELSAVMQRYWINFAATGNPNGDGLPEWPLFEQPGAQAMELGDQVRPIPAPEPAMCATFEAWNSQRAN